MADMKIPGGLPTPLARPGSARTDAVRAAHRAFFQVAAGETQAVAKPEPKLSAKAAAAPNAKPVKYFKSGFSGSVVMWC